MTRIPADPRLPALGLITAACSSSADPRAAVDLFMATAHLLTDAEPEPLIRGLVQVAVKLASDHALCCGTGPLEVLRGAALDIQGEERVCLRPWADPDRYAAENPQPAPQNRREDPSMALFRKAAEAPVDPVREALEEMFKGRPTIDATTGRINRNGWSKQEHDDAELQAAAEDGDVELDGDGTVISVRVSDLIPEEDRDQHLFEWPDSEWTSAAGDRLGLQLADAGRAKRAKALAMLGGLTTREIEHLRWLASAENGFEAVPADTEPISRDAAEDIVQVIERTEQQGRRWPTANRGDSDLFGILEER